MITLYLRDNQNIYYGSGEYDPMGAVPARSTTVEPPSLTGTEVARWNGIGWDVLPERPPVPTPPAPVPQSVSRAQGKAALIQAGLWSAVVAYVDAMTDPTEKALAEVALNDTTEWQRPSPFLNAAATALGLTETQLDDFFRTAATIQL